MPFQNDLSIVLRKFLDIFKVTLSDILFLLFSPNVDLDCLKIYKDRIKEICTVYWDRAKIANVS